MEMYRPAMIMKKIFFQELTFGEAPFRIEGEGNGGGGQRVDMGYSLLRGQHPPPPPPGAVFLFWPGGGGGIAPQLSFLSHPHPHPHPHPHLATATPK